jgi:hypothetical protein
MNVRIIATLSAKFLRFTGVTAAPNIDFAPHRDAQGALAYLCVSSIFAHSATDHSHLAKAGGLVADRYNM